MPPAEGQLQIYDNKHEQKIFRNISSKEKIISTLRNTILLSLLLGLTWITAAIPTSVVQQYISVILNASSGVYILVYSVLANKKVRGGVKERVSTYYTTYMSSGGKDKVDIRFMYFMMN